MIQERLKALRAEMEKRGITVYVVPTADFHESEYVGDHFKARKFITGFTGSAGTAVITLDEAGLWTDGRYFVQAENQLKDSTVTLYRMGEEGVPTVDEFVKDRLKEGGCLGFDGRVVNGTWGGKLEKIAAEKAGIIKNGIPVVADGVIATVAALIAVKLQPEINDYIIVSHQGKEPAMKALLDSLGKKAVIHAELSLGEGTGAVMMFPLLDMALQVYRGNTTFDDIQIAAYEDYGKC